ncbi:hypothetical protein L209DRAFT_463981 [Thermothelomyces heterothallicus CBS 203.75]
METCSGRMVRYRSGNGSDQICDEVLGRLCKAKKAEAEVDGDRSCNKMRVVTRPFIATQGMK